MSTDLAQQWATRINRTMVETVSETVAGLLATGRAFIAAKKELRHGGWERMFAGHPQAVKDPVPCSVRQAQMFMRIAAHPILAKTNHGSLLPASWHTLYELTRLPEPTLRKALADGRVNPWMPRREVAALRNGPARRTPTRPAPTGTELLNNFYRRVWYAFPDYPVDEQLAMVERLRQIAAALEGVMSGAKT